jgi:putative hemolysin
MEEIEKPESKQGLIDIERVLKNRSKKLYRFIPRFLINYLKRISHQDQVNQFISGNGGAEDFDFLKEVLFEGFKVNVQVNNLDLLPATKKCIVVANHPLGGIDGMALLYAIGLKRQDVKTLSNNLLMEVKPLKNLFIPVNPFGRTSLEAARTIEEYFAADNCLMIFPAGLVSRKQKGGVIKDLEWKKTFITKSIKHRRDVIPVHISGQNSMFFYNLSLWRRRLGIKMNIEMLYLVDEMFKQQGKNIEITFGQPISFTTFTSQFKHSEWAAKIKEHVYAIPQGKKEFIP